ncbi:carbohydrate ABC transporter permease [Cobetia amphilecti]|jgi:trehalose/maltose transport system permease protein|uniref:Carbohydrate ABC transporter permease n=2 Tax=Cobetia TaxID=204286 RepID=A0A558HIG9_9GAMM|nr:MULTISPECIES: carbohydrate ABC transporter permease [Cobetia]MBR9753397.1 carbohydrate ABC transporter permease [Gammaproteobacteria bacterium]AOM01703.1 sugar ABC transporter permease [Cobetia marina]AZV31586.1 carbohydrate ABC transporter permease [Cobetia sp. ICG0124]MBF08682.1 carbohydrate ABC transporter permease [Cobetia sp.]MDH2374826.1 carbohydrate ABC transporter permease [Cobetia sp. 3AK]
MNRYQLTRLAKHVGKWALIAIIIVYAVFPFYYAVITSLKPSSELFEVNYWLTSLDFSNYAQIFAQKSFLQAIGNSILIALSVVLIALLLGITASYALGRVRFRGRSTVMLIILGVSMFPQVAVLSGLFEVIRSLNLYNNPGGLILSYTIFTLPFTVWVLTTFMRQLPMELEEAAIMDGATPWETITKVFLPLMWPAMATTGLLAFIAAWNEFLFALTFTLTDSERTVPVAIALISGGSQHELPWGPIMAASVTVTIPLVILVMIFQRRIVSGLTAGAVKG